MTPFRIDGAHDIHTWGCRISNKCILLVTASEDLCIEPSPYGSLYSKNYFSRAGSSAPNRGGIATFANVDVANTRMTIPG
jgi:hypothetical protein